MPILGGLLVEVSKRVLSPGPSSVSSAEKYQKLISSPSLLLRLARNLGTGDHGIADVQHLPFDDEDPVTRDQTSDRGHVFQAETITRRPDAPAGKGVKLRHLRNLSDPKIPPEVSKATQAANEDQLTAPNPAQHLTRTLA